MNRLPWLKHDSNASLDTWLRKCIRNQGHEVGWIFWGLCEQMQSHGINNKFTRNITDLANYSCTSPRVIVRVLNELALQVPIEPGAQVAPGVPLERKVKWNRVGNDLTIEIKNFTKKQHNLKIKVDSKHPQTSGQDGLEEDKSRVDEDKEKDLAAKRRKAEKPKKKKTRPSDFQNFMDRYLKHYFNAPLGVDSKEAKGEVKALYARYGKAGSAILALAGNDVELAIRGVSALAAYFKSKNLSYTLDTIARHFPDWKNDNGKFSVSGDDSGPVIGGADIIGSIPGMDLEKKYGGHK